MSLKFKTLSIFILTSIIALAQEQKPEEPTVKVGGFVRYDLFMDTYKSVDTRDGELYLYPRPEALDSFGNDINENLQLEMLSLTTRLNVAINGPNILGAKTSALIEGDFLGTSQDLRRHIRLRHAFIKFTWANELQVLMGHYWHPMFVTECFANPLTWAVALPFHPLNRSPQLRLSYPVTNNLTLVSALLVHGAHRSTGPDEAQRDAGLPDAQLQLKFNSENYFFALTGGYKFLKPRLSQMLADSSIRETDETISDLNLGVNIKADYNFATFKAGAVYGENLTHLVMIGGIGANKDPEATNEYGYSSMKTYSTWIDVHTNGTYRLGFTGGYTENLGGTSEYYPLKKHSRGENINYVYSMSPRVTYHENNFQAGIEYKFTAAAYGTAFDKYYRATETADETINHRILFTALYKF